MTRAISDRKKSIDGIYTYTGNANGNYTFDGSNFNSVTSGYYVQTSAPDGTTDYYVADIHSVTDYYAFGQPMPGRNTSISSYRYGMNGQEREDEVLGNEGITSAEYWMYDSRIGRRFENDPITTTWQSPYTTFKNNPIFLSDPSGDIVHVHGSWRERRAFWKLYRSNAVFRDLIDKQKTMQRRVTREGHEKADGEQTNGHTYYVDEHFHYNTSSDADSEEDLITLAQAMTAEQAKRQESTDKDPTLKTGNNNTYKGDYHIDEEIKYGNSFLKPIRKRSRKKYTSVDITVTGGSNDDTGEDIITFYSGKEELGSWSIPTSGYENVFEKHPTRTFHFDLPKKGRIWFEIRGGEKPERKSRKDGEHRYRNKSRKEGKKAPGAGGGKVKIEKSRPYRTPGTI